jgi:hypothetical protein
MKQLVFQTFLILVLMSLTEKIIAQQAKAYETVNYTARINNSAFYLGYADGYIGASKIKLVSTHNKPKLFTPASGTPEANGDFVLTLNLGADKREIILTGINEDVEAPKTIRGTYRERGRVLALLFYKNKH